MAPTDPILDLDTLTDRRTITINKKSFKLRSLDEFSFLYGRQLGKRYQRLGALLSAEKLTKKDEGERDRLLDDFCRLILVAPDQVHQALEAHHRARIVNAFFTRPSSQPTAPAPRRSTKTVRAVPATTGSSPRV